MLVSSSCTPTIQPRKIPIVAGGSDFSTTLPYDAGTDAQYSFDPTKIELVGGVARLKTQDTLDDDGSSSGFGGALVSSGTQWDTGKSALRLSQTAATNLSELDSSWIPQPTHLVHYWKLNESAPGTAGHDFIDSAGGGNDGTINGTITLGTAGKLRAAPVFAAGSYVAPLATSNAVKNAANSFSVVFWVNPTSTRASSSESVSGTPGVAGQSYANFPVCANYGANVGCAGVSVGTNGVSVFEHGPGYLPPLLVYDTTISTWTQVVVVYNNRTPTLYLNGQQVHTGLTSTMPQVFPSIALGDYSKSFNGNYGPFQGAVDDFAIWDIALTPAEVRLLYSRQSAQSAATIASRVMGTGAVGPWNSLGWTSNLPFLKPLPDFNAGAVQNESSANYPSLVGSNGMVGTNDLMSGIAGLWHLDESAGTTGAGSVIDQSGNSKHGTPASVQFGAEGRFSKAATFNGSNSAIAFPSFDFTSTSQVSVAFWYNSPSTPSVARILLEQSSNYNLVNGGFVLFHDTDGRIYCSHKGNAGYSQWAGGVIPNQTWVHVACVFNIAKSSSESQVYLNGSLSGAISPSYNSDNTGFFRNDVIYLGARGGNSYGTFGLIDEVAIWSRALHPSEIQQLYRRGVNRVLFQVRTCSNGDCSDDPTGANWKGPDGSRLTYFSELFNKSIQAVSPSGNVLSGTPSMLFSNFVSPPAPARYFQYRAILESDDSGTGCDYGAGPTWCSPEIRSVRVGPTRYDSQAPAISNRTPIPFRSLSSFVETVGAGGCAGGIRYEISIDGSSWLYHNGTSWTASDGSYGQSSTAATLQLNMGSLQVPGSPALYLKALLASDGTQPCELDQIGLSGKN